MQPYDQMALLSSYLPLIIGFVAVCAALGIFSFISMRKKANNYLAKYPDAVKVYADFKFMGVAQSQVIVERVDGEVPTYFNGGVYVKPGTSRLTVNYDFSRMGVIYKSVSKSTGSTEVEVTLEAGKTYKLSFDKDKGFYISEKN